MGRSHRITIDRFGPLQWRWRLYCAGEERTDRMEQAEEGTSLSCKRADKAAQAAARKHIGGGVIDYRVIQSNGHSVTIEARSGPGEGR